MNDRYEILGRGELIAVNVNVNTRSECCKIVCTGNAGDLEVLGN